MNVSKQILCLIVMLLSGIVSVQAQESAQPPLPPKYRLELIHIFDVAQREYVFVVGQIGFKSVESLKKFLSDLPAGSILEWAPGCVRRGDEPLLSSVQDMEDFQAFCIAKQINFIILPSG